MLVKKSRFRTFTVFLLSLAAFLLAENPGRLTVAVTLPPYAKIVREVAGENVDVVTLVPPDANPHTFEPKPSTLREFSKASLYLSDGSGLDEAWRPRFLGVNPKVRVVDISAGVSWMREAREHVHEHKHSHEAHGIGEGELDPHLWTSPRTGIVIASNVCAALSDADGRNAGTYRANLEKFSKRLSDLDVKISKTVSTLPADRRTFIVFHPSFGYLARDYGLKQVAVEVGGKEPKPRDLQRLVQAAKKFRAGAVFVQPQFSRRAAESLSREIEAKVVSADPLAYDFDLELVKFLEAFTGEAK